MTNETSREIRSEITSEGKLLLSIATVDKPTPKEDEVLIKWKLLLLIHLI